MKDNKHISDEVITPGEIYEIHNRLMKRNALYLADEMLMHELSMYSYVKVCGLHIEEFMEKYPVPPRVLKQLNDEVVKRMLVVIEAQRQAHYMLWRDLMGDPAPDQPDDRSDNTTNGDNHG